MKTIKKLRLIFCMGLIVVFGMTACASKEQQAKVDSLLERNKELVQKMNQAYEDHKSGTLTTAEFADLTTAIKSNIETTKDEVEKLREEGLGWGELAVSVLIGAAGRGIPSKGPLGALFNMMSARRKEE